MLAFLIGQVIQADTYGLLWRPAKGDTLSYVYYMSEGEGDKATSIESPVSMTVTAVNEDGYTVRSIAKDMLITASGEQMRDKREVVTVAQYGSRGNLVKITEGTPNLERARITKFIAPPTPMKVGETWSHMFPKEGTPPLQPTLMYKFKEIKVEEGRQLAVIEFSLNRGGEDKPSATGVWAIDAQTGVPERMEAKTDANGGTVFKLKRVRS